MQGNLLFAAFYPGYYFGVDLSWLLVMIPCVIITLAAQAKVKSTYAKYSEVLNDRGLTASQVARRILDQNGLYEVCVSRVSGNLTDHFDPRTNVVRLSDSVCDSTSVAAIGVAAHECGHAIQHAKGYLPIKLRMAVIPICNFGSRLSIPLILLGCLFSLQALVNFGILLYSFLLLFQLITLPVEFNASRRAMEIIRGDGLLTEAEQQGAKKTLQAAAMTYVASMLVALMQFLRILVIFGNRRRR
ncbi:MAG: zinc metallopeptidase [Oscillospiraceae bacterium]|nr:zinc metallopeptidase [Oscillospiraceae bacterium]